MNDIREVVRTQYGAIAKNQGSCCAPTCCSPLEKASQNAALVTKQIGYSDDEIGAIPDGANLGLGCGNPQALAELKTGEVVVDLGSGGGLDVFLAARSVGPSGRAIGVDMTSDMVTLARENAAKADLKNVEFRLGEIENLPVADQTADVVLSNCVVNLSPDKAQVFREAHRVLKAGGRLAISDIVALRELPAHIHDSVAHYVGCAAGAARTGELREMLEAAGFLDVDIEVQDTLEPLIEQFAPGEQLERYVASAKIRAVRGG